MLRLRWAIVISIVVHWAGLMLIALLFSDSDSPPSVFTKLVFEMPEMSEIAEETAVVQLPLVPAFPIPPEKEIPSTESRYLDSVFVVPHLAQPELLPDSVRPPDGFDILTGNTPELRERAVRQALLQNSLEATIHHKLDSIQTRQKILNYAMSRFLMNPEQLRKLSNRPDAFGSSQTAKSLGSNPGMIDIPGLITGIGRSISGWLGEKPQKPMVGGAAGIPTLLEIDVLNNLWTFGQETDHRLYAALDTTYQITLIDFNRILDVMTKKGWLVRQKISPENIFTIATPLGGIPVEMSAKNRRNPVFSYRPTISQEMVMRALNLAAFHLEDAACLAPDSVRTIQKLEKQRIQQKIMKLIEN